MPPVTVNVTLGLAVLMTWPAVGEVIVTTGSEVLMVQV
jgi:hypothetical protein